MIANSQTIGVHGSVNAVEQAEYPGSMVNPRDQSPPGMLR